MQASERFSFSFVFLTKNRHNSIGTIGAMDLITNISKLNHLEHLSLGLQWWENKYFKHKLLREEGEKKKYSL